MMRILLDTCMSQDTKAALLDVGHDVIWTHDWPSDPGDTEILAAAFRENRVLMTLDKDFGELAIRLGQPHAGLVRLSGFRRAEQPNACLETIRLYERELNSGSVVVVEPGRVRIRRGTIQ